MPISYADASIDASSQTFQNTCIEYIIFPPIHHLELAYAFHPLEGLYWRQNYPVIRFYLTVNPPAFGVYFYSFSFSFNVYGNLGFGITYLPIS